MCYTDKRRAIKRKFRIEESTLLFISLLGGCFGFLLECIYSIIKIEKLNLKY